MLAELARGGHVPYPYKYFDIKSFILSIFRGNNKYPYYKRHSFFYRRYKFVENIGGKSLMEMSSKLYVLNLICHDEVISYMQ